ncbi:hypothetical protein AT248_04935 [Bartonella henselae]|nr:hypothetical protein BhenCHDE101_07475 [Bartonella henselae]PNM38990.1 hypothetical protein AL470_006785 [Bartonella henselae str. Houston-1]OLL40673.1 hypothetical protein AT237_06220 [Bartonella henselae]OLL41148.1 hypothetical protein AT244_00165 [Bartonella henselae]OLL45255.1 hypothetical protein AT245_07640 [Bartonella henselae]
MLFCYFKPIAKQFYFLFDFFKGFSKTVFSSFENFLKIFTRILKAVDLKTLHNFLFFLPSNVDF